MLRVRVHVGARVLTRSHLPEALVQHRGDDVGEEAAVCLPVSCRPEDQTRDDVTTDQVLPGLSGPMTRTGKE